MFNVIVLFDTHTQQHNVSFLPFGTHNPGLCSLGSLCFIFYSFQQQQKKGGPDSRVDLVVQFGQQQYIATTLDTYTECIAALDGTRKRKKEKKNTHFGQHLLLYKLPFVWTKVLLLQHSLFYCVWLFLNVLFAPLRFLYFYPLLNKLKKNNNNNANRKRLADILPLDETHILCIASRFHGYYFISQRTDIVRAKLNIYVGSNIAVLLFRAKYYGVQCVGLRSV